MAQSAENTSYFTLSHPSITATNGVKSTAKQSGLLNRRQHQAAYLPQLELPSLPPLSQLLPADKAKKEAQAQAQAVENTDAVAAAVAAAGMIYPSFYNNTNDFQEEGETNPSFNNPSYTTTFPNGTTSMAQLMDPTPAPDNFTTTTTDTMMPINMYNTLPNDGIAPAVTTTNAFMKYEEPNQRQGRQRQLSNSSTSSTEKIYSFVAIPGTNQKKRPRRRYDEIERLYHCSWPSCTKAYGTLNHLNAHVSMQKHVSFTFYCV